MSKFNRAPVRATGTSPVITEATPTGTTFEGGPGYARDPKGELFLLAVTNMVSENTFYERAGQRDQRFAALVRQVAAEDYEWLAGFLPWLRAEANMRSAPLVAAAEVAKVRPGSRALIDAVCQRADEPGELLAYWLTTYGRPVPIAVKRGLSDAIYRLYNERALLKYDSREAALRFGDVIELCNPRTHRRGVRGTWRDDLYKHAIDRRHGRAGEIPASLPVLAARAAVGMGDLMENATTEELRAAGVTWEAAASQGKPNWAKLIPVMGYMALLRNLRNFDASGVSDMLAADVGRRLADPAEVAKSRQFPLRFLSAYRAAPSLRWAWPLEQALNHSLANIPVLPGYTLVLVDRSGSMYSPLSGRSDLQRADAAAVFGSALAARCEKSNLIEFGTGSNDIGKDVTRGESVLRTVRRFTSMGGTETSWAVRRWFDGHDRVVILTDEQAFDSWYGDPLSQVPGGVPVYTWNLAGYQYGHGPSGTGNRHTFGGLTDAGFRMIPLLEAGRRGEWPWLA